jgi:hypothetical protein
MKQLYETGIPVKCKEGWNFQCACPCYWPYSDDNWDCHWNYGGYCGADLKDFEEKENVKKDQDNIKDL